MPAGRPVRKKRPRFSVVTIVRNEADRLPRLLASLADFRARGGEVVVLDTGSGDGTPEVARSAGCRVAVERRRFDGRLTEGQARRINETFSREGEGPFVSPGERLFNFARARNCASGMARHSFQLALDGGDVVDALDVDWLDASIREGGTSVYRFERRVLNRGGWSVEAGDCFYDRRVMEWKGRAHNYLSVIPFVRTRATLLLARDQLRVSHHTDLKKHRGYQLAGTALEALADPGSVRWRHLLARSLVTLGCHRSALPILLGLDRAEASPAARSASLCLAASCVAASGGSSDEVEALLFRAAKRDSGRRDPLLRLAHRRQVEGDMQGAASFAAAALAIPAQAGIGEMEWNHSVGPHAILYWALLWLGRRDEAKRHFKRCRELEPANPVYRDHARLFA